jgi:enterochelin esterase family protein
MPVRHFFFPMSEFLHLRRQMETYSIPSQHLGREVVFEVRTYPKEAKDFSEGLLLLVNDGQDSKAIGLEEALLEFSQTETKLPILSVAILVGERRQEYGIIDRPDFAQRGSKAGAYALFVTDELTKWLKSRFTLPRSPEHRAIMGFSLGALSAFGLAWENAGFLGTAGLFSGSFWWRSHDLDDDYQPGDRIALQLVRETSKKPPLKLWFQTGAMDESADRDQDGLIDSIGDTADLMLALEKMGFQAGIDMEYLESGNGYHDHKTMSRVLPHFLKWWSKTLV